jgi:hypothetical protein
VFVPVGDFLGWGGLIAAVPVLLVRLSWENQSRGGVVLGTLAYYLSTSVLLSPVFYELWTYRIITTGSAVPKRLR